MYKFRLGQYNDLDAIMSLIDTRITWMNNKGINQWNNSDYLDKYPKSYFNDMIAESKLYAATLNDNLIGILVLSDNDEIWNDDKQAYYFHNLATDPKEKDVGKFMINAIEQIAINNNIGYMRMDCQSDNIKLNDYYQKIGYDYIDTFENGSYKGNKREKKLKKV